MGQAIARAAVSYRAGQNEARRTISPDSIGLVLGLITPIVVTAWGASYYFAPITERVRHPMHALLKASGTVGQAFGVLGLCLFLFMWLYPIRKWLGAIRGLGSVAIWMRIHTVVGLSLPLLVAVHAGWRFRGLIGLGYLAMLIVVASGIVGRYLYGRIPRSRAGLELSRDEITAQRRALITEIAAMLRLDPREVEAALASPAPAGPVAGIVGTFRRLVSDDWTRWKAVSDLRKRWRSFAARGEDVDVHAVERALRLARDEIRFAQQLRALEATQRVFRFWHVAHRPVSITALLAVLIHVGVAIAMGQTWLR